MQIIRKTALAFGLAAAVLTGMTHSALAKNPKVTVTQDYAFNGFDWDNGGSLVVVWSVQDIDGMAVVCGAYSTTGKSVIQKLSLAVLKEGKIQVSGETIRRGLSFFKRQPNEGREKRHIGEVAHCRVTKSPYDPGAEYSIKFRDGQYKVPR